MLNSSCDVTAMRRSQSRAFEKTLRFPTFRETFRVWFFGSHAVVMSATPLVWQLARDGDLEGVRRSVSRGARVNEEKSEAGWTALHWAGTNGNVDLAVYLLSVGADPNAQDDTGWTPTLAAGYRGDAVMLRAMVAAGGDVAAVDPRGMNALFWAVDWNKAELVEFLLQQRGLDVNHRAVDGTTAEEYARSVGRPELAGLIRAEVRCGVWAFSWSTFLLHVLSWRCVVLQVDRRRRGILPVTPVRRL